MKTLAFIALTFGLGCHAFVRTPEAAGPQPNVDGPIVLRNGQNAVDLLGDGTPAQAFVAWRGNFNAHGHSSVAFYIRALSDRSDRITEWQIVPLFGGAGGESGRDTFGTTEGADCILGDLRLIQHRGAPADLIVARRDLGRSYADPASTHFDYYTLTRNSAGVVGWPAYYFNLVRTTEARREYCDVNDAFDQELYLGRRGIGGVPSGESLPGGTGDRRRPSDFRAPQFPDQPLHVRLDAHADR